MIVCTMRQYRLLVDHGRRHDNPSSVSKNHAECALRSYDCKVKLTSGTEKVEEKKIERER